jgi:hypothetical protein
VTKPAEKAVCSDVSTPEICMVMPLSSQTMAPVRPLPTVSPRSGSAFGLR